jgi:MSHA pilin protein MshC
MARGNIQLILTTNSVSVTENGSPIIVHSKGYPLKFPSGVTTTALTLTYDKLGRTTASSITLNASGASAVVKVEASGYAY